MDLEELIAANDAAWERLERVSGIDRVRWSASDLRARDSDAHVLLLTMPAVRAAHDEVLQSQSDLERAYREAWEE